MVVRPRIRTRHAPTNHRRRTDREQAAHVSPLRDRGDDRLLFFLVDVPVELFVREVLGGGDVDPPNDLEVVGLRHDAGGLPLPIEDIRQHPSADIWAKPAREEKRLGEHEREDVRLGVQPLLKIVPFSPTGRETQQLPH